MQFHRFSRTALLTGASFAALAAFGTTSVKAQDVPQGVVFGDMIALTGGNIQLPDGTYAKWQGADNPVVGTDADGNPLMTIRQTQQKALLDWERFSLKTEEILEFQQQAADWIAVNRVHGEQASQIDGTIRAQGRVFILNDNGVMFGEGANIDVRQLVTAKGVSDVLVDGAITTIVQKDERAILNWSDMSSQAGEVLRFQQERTDWLAMNRSLLDGTTRLRGDIEADGHVYLIAPGGLSISGSIEAQQVIASSLNMSDEQFEAGLTNCVNCSYGRHTPQFSNTWQPNVQSYQATGEQFVEWLTTSPPEVHDPSDPARYNVVVEREGSIATGALGKIMLFGNQAINNGTLTVTDEGQVILAAGENIWLDYDNQDPGNRLEAFTGYWDPLGVQASSIGYATGLRTVGSEAEADLWEAITGTRYEVGHYFSSQDWGSGWSPGPVLLAAQDYVRALRYSRALSVDNVARNTGIIRAERGGNIDFRGWQLEQMGAIEMTSTANFRGAIDFEARLYAHEDNWDSELDGPPLANNGTVIFGKGSLTQITPDLKATDTIPLTEGAQSVGSVTVNAFRVHVQEDSMIYLPSGEMNVWLDEASYFFGSNRGIGNNQNNETGTRFMMERGATIDLSGWESTVLPMGYHQVTGKLFAAQLADSPLQREGPFYRKEITVDRRYGTDLANWESFDNLTQGTLDMFLTNGGSFFLDADNDFIMKSGAVIDVSGGKITYEAGTVTTTLVRRLDGTIIDIREASPDELYMGLANEFVQYDTKWGEQRTFIVPFLSSTQTRYEEGYVEGGNAGSIDILAPDAILQGTVLGGVTVGKFQRRNMPEMGSFTFGNGGQDEGEYKSNNVLIEATERLISDHFRLTDSLELEFGDLFGEEFDESQYEQGESVVFDATTRDNTLLVSDKFFNRSSMGSYMVIQGSPERDAEGVLSGPSVIVDPLVQLNLAHGASFALRAEEGALEFGGSIRTEGGDIQFSAPSIVFGDDVVLDTSAGWINEFESWAERPLAPEIRIDGGDISIVQVEDERGLPDGTSFVMPASMVLDLDGGAWARRDGTVVGGKGGSLEIATLRPDVIDLGALDDASALGLGGNGSLSFVTANTVFIGDQPGVFPVPEVPGGEIPGGRDADEQTDGGSVDSPGYLLFSPDLFADSGFSAISIVADRLMVTEGTRIDASTLTLRLKQANLTDAHAPWQMAASGTDMAVIADTVSGFPLGMKSEGARRGMDIRLMAESNDALEADPASGALIVGKGTSIVTQPGGTLSLGSDSEAGMEILGLLQADGGSISLNAGTNAGGTLRVGSNAVLRSRGAAVVTEIVTAPDGGEWRDGYLLDGGDIGLSAGSLVIEDGAVLDVRGASATFDVVPEDGSRLTRMPATFASDGGRISINAQSLDVEGATYFAQAGGAGASGGSFTLGFGAEYGGSDTGGGLTPQDLLNYLIEYFQYGYFLDADGNPLTEFLGTDLGQVADLFGTPVDIEDGLVFNTPEEFLKYFSSAGLAAAGAPPALVVGDTDIDFTFAAGGASVDPGLIAVAEMFGYVAGEPYSGPDRIARLPVDAIVAGGFSNLSLTASPGLIFAGEVDLGGRRADGSYQFDNITLSAPSIMAIDGANVAIEAQTVDFAPAQGVSFDASLYAAAIGATNVGKAGSTAVFTASSGTLTDVVDARFNGFGTVNLLSDGDIRLRGYGVNNQQAALGRLETSGDLRIRADQLYAATGRDFTVKAGGTLEILPQTAGQPLNGTPYEAAATLRLEAPRIIQGGIVRSPLGAIILNAVDDGSEGAGAVRLLGGSITSVSSGGNIVPYGALNNGDTWIDPLSNGSTVDDRELRILPERRVTVQGKNVDLREGALVDLSGGGDLLASEFTAGVGGTVNWLGGYFDENYDWVDEGGEIYAIVPNYQGDVAPVGLSTGGPRVGEKIYLSGGSGLKAGYYTLMPAEYALLPGAFRVTAHHQYGGDYTDVQLGGSRPLNDGSSLQAGYTFVGDEAQRDPRTNAYLVMPRKTLFTRSSFQQQVASGYFGSERFLEKALRENKEVPDAPRTPLDGGSIVLAATETMNLNATLNTEAAKGGRGGLADVQAEFIAVVSDQTDRSQYEGYLLLESDQLNRLGAESLLLGGVRRQGEINLELTVGARDVVIDNAGATLSGPELIFASRGDVTVTRGSTIETSGRTSGKATDLRVLAAYAPLVDDKGTSWESDDEIIHEALDGGAILRLSANEQIDLLRDPSAVDRFASLVANPASLAAVNEARAAFGLDPVVPGGILDIRDGARVSSGRSLTLDATRNTLIDEAAVVTAPQISASASRISIGNVPDGAGGLVFAGGSLGPLAAAQDIILKSYSAIDFHGAVTLQAEGALTLDAREIAAIGADGETILIGGSRLELANSNGGTATVQGGTATLRLEGDNIYLSGSDKWISGAGAVELIAAQRVIGQDENTLYVPGALNIEAGEVTATSGSRQFFDAGGRVSLAANGAALDDFATFGATLGFTGSSVTNNAKLALTGGTVSLRAREGDVALAGGRIDVTSDQVEIFDKLVGVGAGNVSLISDRGDIVIREGAVIDVSGGEVGGDAGLLQLTAGLGEVALGGTILGRSAEGSRSGSLRMTSRTIGDFGALNAALDEGGFLQTRAFEVNEGDVQVGGIVRAQEFALVANAGEIEVTGTIETPGAHGGKIQLSAARDVSLASGARLLARATSGEGAGGTVLLETVGEGGGAINVASGALIDVSGTGEGGRTVRFRAPQVGNDVAIGSVDGTITGARTVIAEAYRSYDGIGTIDQAVIDTVSSDAAAFMTNAAAINQRLGRGIRIAPGIEIRNDGDIELTTDWDLSSMRYGGVAGVLTLRAEGDLLINANLSDGFDGATADADLLGGPSWAINLAAGANIASPNSLAVLPQGQLSDASGSVVIGGTPDTLEYYIREDNGLSRLYLIDQQGRFLRDENEGNAYLGFVELQRDPETGDYLDPLTGERISADPETGDYLDGSRYAKRPLPYVMVRSTEYLPTQDMMQVDYISVSGKIPGGYLSQPVGYLQWDNSTGYLVRTGTSAINVAAGRDLVLQEKASVLYTAGEAAALVPDFHPSAAGYTPTNGGDIDIAVTGSVIGAASEQLPSAWLLKEGQVSPQGFFAEVGDGEYDQLTWYVAFDRYRAGIGALGGGNVSISAGGDVHDLTVNIPTTGRVAGGRSAEEGTTFYQTGGGNLSLRAGGNLRGGVYYVGDGLGEITAGGAFIGTPDAVARINEYAQNGELQNCWGSECYVHADPDTITVRYDLYPVFFTSGGELRLKSGGDLNVDAVLDPLIAENVYETPGRMISYTPDASVSMFSAGGDIRIWNNHYNIAAYREIGRQLQHVTYFEPATNPTFAINLGVDADVQLWPATVQATAAAGSIYSYGGMLMAPAAKGNLELVARQDVQIGKSGNPNRTFSVFDNMAGNFQSASSGIYISQALPEYLQTPDNPLVNGLYVSRAAFENAGMGVIYPYVTPFGLEVVPDLHAGDTEPVRIYAGEGKAVLTDAIVSPKAMMVRSGTQIYFPRLSIQHNNPNDLTLLKAGEGIYFTGSSHVTVSGEGRLEFEAGSDFWIPSNGAGISTQRIVLDGGNTAPDQEWHPDRDAADIAITVGLEQEPDYAGFADWLFNPEGGETPDYALVEAGDGRELSMYLFDRLNGRADRSDKPVLFDTDLRAGFVNYIRGLQGLEALESETEQGGYLGEAWDYWLALPAGQKTPFDSFFPRGDAAREVNPVFYLPQTSEGLVNYVRRVNGMEMLETQEEQLAFLDDAWDLWEAMPIEAKTPFYRSVLNMELRTTGREANDPDSERNNTTFRGYDAIAKLFPGAQRRADETLAEGEARWDGDFETFASRVLSRGGGDIDFVIPGGELMLANVAATNGQTGQPAYEGDQGNALRAGLITENGGAINIFAHDSVTVNNSRILTAKGGNILIWSSYGDIAAGKGAKTSISPAYFNYSYNDWFDRDRSPAGLPTGAGIGTLASVDGAPAADVDLIAPNGIVDAGDAGIRVSGNFNVFAVQILGTDNIDVSGIATGLPVPPAAPPTSLDTGDVAAQANRAIEAITEAMAQVQENASVMAPSIIEVRVTGYGCPEEDLTCAEPISRRMPGAQPKPEQLAMAHTALPPAPVDQVHTLSIASQPLKQAIGEVSRKTGTDIIYDSDVPVAGATQGVRGTMTAEEALRVMVRELGLEPVKSGPRSIVLRRRS